MAEQLTERAAFSGSPLSKSRLRSLVIPREHGAWGMLLVPLATGASVGLLIGGRVLFLPWLVVVTVVIFWLRTPVESWLGTSPLRTQSTEERNAVLRVISLLAAVAGIALAGMFWAGENRQLLALGIIAGVAFAAQAGLKRSRKTRILAQLVGALGLTLTAPAAYCVTVGHVNRLAVLLWLSNWLFAVNQIQFVQLRIHSTRVARPIQKLARGRGFVVTQSAAAGILLAAWWAGTLPGLVLLAFVPALVRGTAWFFALPGPLLVRRLGWTELAHDVAFGIILVAGFCFRT